MISLLLYIFSHLKKKQKKLSRGTAFPILLYVRAAKIQINLCLLKNDSVFGTLSSAKQWLISLRICAGWSESLLGGHAILWVMLCPGSYYRTELQFYGFYRYVKTVESLTNCKKKKKKKKRKKKKKKKNVKNASQIAYLRNLRKDSYSVMFWSINGVLNLFSTNQIVLN